MGSGRGFGIGPVGVMLALLAVFVSYLACLYGAELDQQSLAAFGFWSIVGILAAWLVDLLYKVVLTLVILFVAALFWTDNPALQRWSDSAQVLRGNLCERLPLDNPDMPIKEWIC